MDKPHNEGFYYHAAAYEDFDLAGEVYRALDTLLHSSDYNLSVYRCLEPESQEYVVVVIGERPSRSLDLKIVEHLVSTGEMVTLNAELLQNLLGRRPDMN
jgi:hypothetical protein